MVREYLKAVVLDAWSQTRQRFGETWQGWFVACLTFGIGFAYHAIYADWSEALNNAVVSLLTGIFATLTVILLYYLWKTFSAPYRLWAKAQRQLARATIAQDYKKIADDLQSCIKKGLALQQQHRSSSTFNADIRIWQKTAEGIVEKCGNEELAMFQTLTPPLVRGALYTDAYRVRDKRALKAMIVKLRNIMARQYQLNAALKGDGR
jgi:hypothetical protein